MSSVPIEIKDSSSAIVISLIDLRDDYCTYEISS